MKNSLIENIKTGGMDSLNSESRRRVVFSNVFSLIGASTIGLFSISYFFAGHKLYGFIELGFSTLGVINMLAFRKHKNYNVVSSMVLILMHGVLLFLLYTGGINHTGIYWYFTFVPLAFFFKGYKEGIYWNTSLITITLFVGLLASQGFLIIDYSFIELRQFFASYTIAGLLVFIFAYVLQQESSKFKEYSTKLETELNTRLQLERSLKETNGDLENVKKSVLNILEDLNVEKLNLTKEKNKLDAVLLSVGDGLIVTDPEGRVILVNAASKGLLGWTDKDAIGKKFVDLVEMLDSHGKKIDQEKRLISKTLEDKQSFKSEDAYFYKGKNQRIFPISISVSPILLNDELLGSVEVFRDISKEKEYIAEVEKFKLAVEDASDQIVMTDPEGLVVYGNKAVKTITGYDPSEVLGQKAGKLWGNLMPREYYEKMWQTIKIKKQSFESQLKNVRKDGTEYYAEIHITPIVDYLGEIKFFVAIERDITKERQVDEAKTEFVSLASHQLRTPLSAIKWYAELLLGEDSGKLNKEQEDYVQEIYKGNERMVDLVNALLNVSRIDLGTFEIDPKPIDITEIANNVIGEIKPQIAQKSQKLTLDFEKMPKINLDPNLIDIIFQNLISNAVKYTPEKGEIKVIICKDRKFIYIKVKDNGYGIPESQRSKIYDKLFRADNIIDKDAEGTGLGLYIVKSIIDQSKGTIDFTSKLNKGTEFIVKLPIKGMPKKEGTKGLT